MEAEASSCCELPPSSQFLHRRSENQFSWASPVAQEPNETLISRTNRSVVKCRVINGGGGGGDGDDVVGGKREKRGRE